jgi:type II secretory pathway component GspD/PulD (secretin)
MRAVNESTVSQGKVDWRFSNGVLEISSDAAFDKREIKLSIYDLSGIIGARIETYHEEREKIVEEVAALLREFVYSNGWRENGGELSRMTIVGDRMFVEAPERYHTQIKWMLEQLPAKGKARAESDPLKSTVVRLYPMKNADATSVANSLKGTLGMDQPEVWGVSADARTNTVIVSGTAIVQRRAEDLLQVLDEPGPAKAGGGK